MSTELNAVENDQTALLFDTGQELLNEARGAYMAMWTAPNGCRYPRFEPRRIGTGELFGIFCRPLNDFLPRSFPTRQAAWDFLKGK